jgi:undecaprenyl diphosphate synthase
VGRAAGLERVRGHQQGARSVRDVVTECARLRKAHGGPDYLTLYSFSIENWKRPANEVTFLMQMYIEYLRSERATMMENNIRFRQIGRLDNLPDPVLDEVNETLAVTEKNDGLQLVLALNYGSRTEIADAVRAIAEKAKAGRDRPARRHGSRRSPNTCTPPTCPTRICSSARPARCASATTCCGRSATPSCTSAKCCGRTSA